VSWDLWRVDPTTRLAGAGRGDPRRDENQDRGSGETSAVWHPWHGVRLSQKGLADQGATQDAGKWDKLVPLFESVFNRIKHLSLLSWDNLVPLLTFPVNRADPGTIIPHDAPIMTPRAAGNQRSAMKTGAQIIRWAT
jgi:hypothetical protein